MAKCFDELLELREFPQGGALGGVGVGGLRAELGSALFETLGELSEDFVVGGFGSFCDLAGEGVEGLGGDAYFLLSSSG